MITLTAAAALSVASPVAAQNAPEAPHIALSEVAPQTWRVNYELEAPTTSLLLLRATNDARLTRWTARDAAFEMTHMEDGDLVRRKDGGAFVTVAFDVSATYTPLPKDYAPFSPFGDGGLLIHSGRFHACTSACPTDETGDEGPWRITVTPADGARIIVDGAIHNGSATFIDSGDGTNIYVGAATPIETDHFIAVIDDAFPGHVGDTLADLFPRLMDYYAERLGALENKPMLFASHDAAHGGDSRGAQGGTLPGQVFMHLYGPDWGEASEASQGWIPWFFAHEAGHLYQRFDGAMFDDSESWIHEGGADAFAAIVLGDMDAAPDGYVDQRINDAYEGCAASLRERPLSEAAENGDYAAHYACGLLMQLAADASIRRASGDEADLFDLWAAYKTRIAGGAKWSGETFLAIVEEMGAPETAAFLATVAAERVAEPATTLRHGLNAAGVALAPEDAD